MKKGYSDVFALILALMLCFTGCGILPDETENTAPSHNESDTKPSGSGESADSSDTEESENTPSHDEPYVYMSHTTPPEAQRFYDGGAGDEDGSASILMPEGRVVTIRDNVYLAYTTADRQHISVLQKDGTLYVTDWKYENKVTVTDQCAELKHKADGGFVYMTEDGMHYRYTYADGYSCLCRR